MGRQAPSHQCSDCTERCMPDLLVLHLPLHFQELLPRALRCYFRSQADEEERGADDPEHDPGLCEGILWVSTLAVTQK